MELLLHYFSKPPSTLKTCPVIKRDISEDRKATESAISEGSAFLFMIFLDTASASSSADMEFPISVDVRPGATALTLIPKLPNSIAILRIAPTMAALLALYSILAPPSKAADEEI